MEKFRRKDPLALPAGLRIQLRELANGLDRCNGSALPIIKAMVSRRAVRRSIPRCFSKC